MVAESSLRRRGRPSTNDPTSKTVTVNHHYGSRFYWKLAWLLGVGLVFHLVYMLSIFDIYFRSPLVQGIEPVAPMAEAPAKRLVLFVGDGCRADKAFEMKPDGSPRMPFLHSICREKGSFGVSHTRVPTESRPGHIAMIAGFYEDVSAVTKGWKANPVNYDHVLARAKHAWSFGAPEIVDLFSGPNVYGQHYSAKMIDFAASTIYNPILPADCYLEDAKSLDQWSFDRLRELLEAASIDDALAGKLKSDQIVIFVHLLGLDTNGHAFKPHSKEYLENVEFVDAGIKRAVQELESFYGNDGKTAYIYTADHGMSDGGTHGDGDPDNTRTPLVTWGAGVSDPQPVSLGLRDDHDSYSAGWNLEEFRRRDIHQADMTPFMAALVGIPVPVNSEGVLPIKLLGTSQEHKSLALLDNARQISVAYRTKESLKASKEPVFRPAAVSAAEVESRLAQVSQMISQKEYADAQKTTFALFKDALAGMSYLHKYDSSMLKTVCTAGYLGWIAQALVFIVRNYGDRVAHEAFSPVVTLLFTMAFCGLSFFLILKGSPLQYHMYSAFAFGFWHQVAQARSTLRHILAYPFLNAPQIPSLLAYGLGLELLVLTFFRREVLAGINALLAVALLFRFGKRCPLTSVFWCLACLAISAFPFLAPIKLANEALYFSGIAAIMAVSAVGYFRVLGNSSILSKLGFLIRLGLIAVAGFIAKDSDSLLKAKQGLPLWNQNVAWILLIFSLASPILATRKRGKPVQAMARLLVLFMSLAPAYILLSIAYETLFYAAFAAQLALWISLESRPSAHGRAGSVPLGLGHLWIAFGFLFFVNLAFFGTGNMASISSFTLESVYRFITVFAPFPMATLLILKLLLPFVLLSAVFGVLSHRSGAPSFSLVLLVLATTDIMTLNFFFLVRDHGSWLEIGTSISHFVIASSLIVFTLFLFGLSNLLMSGVTFDEDRVSHAETRRSGRTTKAN